MLLPPGVLPPYIGNDPKIPASMSPYACTLLETAAVFCKSKERVRIFKGLLEYRKELGRLGFSMGFQWLSGSYLEDIEAMEGRAPRDIDIVTFCMRPATWVTPADEQAALAANPDVFQPPRAKVRYYCDLTL
jgi:hypothetical protein